MATSTELDKITATITDGSARASILIYAGVVFLLMMTMLMGYTVAAMGNVRETEAEGHLDNLLGAPSPSTSPSGRPRPRRADGGSSTATGKPADRTRRTSPWRR